MKYIFSFLICSIFVNVSIANDFDVLLSRLTDLYVTQSNASNAPIYYSSLQADGSWTDIDYGFTGRTQWAPSEHVKRIKTLATAYVLRTDPLYLYNGLKEAIEKALDYWYTVNPTSDNWWNNIIGKQLSLGPIAIMLKNVLDAERLNKIIDDLATSTGNYTGQNKTWVAEQIIWRGCLEDNLTRVIDGLKVFTSELRISDEEGIKVDMSFHQHGAQLHLGAYGREFLNYQMKWAYLTRNLQSFKFSDSQVHLLSRYLSEGTLYTMRNKYQDFSVLGRSMSRRNATIYSSLDNYIQNFMEVDTSHREFYQAAIDHVLGKNDGAIVGSKHFFKSDYYVHRQKNYFFSIKMNSERTVKTESINEENLQGYNLCEGLTNISVEGSEYLNIFPCWNWSHLPGTTTPDRSKSKAPSGGKKTGNTRFAGGVTNGDAGVAAYTMDWDSTQAKKSWFMFDNEIVALGTDINSTSTNSLFTTLNQSIRMTDMYAKNNAGATEKMPETTGLKKEVKWLWHSNTGYVFPESQETFIENKTVTGDWNDINTGQYNPGKYETKNVITMMLPHGKQPADERYEYIIVPGVSLNEMENYTGSHISILRNDRKVQAVLNTSENITGIVFQVADTLMINDTLWVYADKPCLMLLDLTTTNPLIYLSDPNQTTSAIHVSFIRNRITETYYVSLPGDQFAGQTVEFNIDSIVYPTIAEVSSEMEAEFRASNIIDGDKKNTRWFTTGFPQYLIVDYGMEVPMNSFSVWTNEDWPYQYKVWAGKTIDACLAKHDSSRVVDRSSNVRAGSPYIDEFETVSARYVMFEVTGIYNNPLDWVAIFEIEIGIEEDVPNTVSEISQPDQNLSVYPNPFRDFVSIQNPQNKEMSFQVLTIDGRIIMQDKLTPMELRSSDFSDIKKGMYILNSELGALKIVKE